MQFFHGNVEVLTEQNTSFRKVIFTGQYSQLVLMCLKPGEEIGEEIHYNVDQFFRIEAGKGKIIIDGIESELGDGIAAIVPAGAKHNIINSGDTDLKLYTIYSPANHPIGTIHETKTDADAAEADHHHN